MIVGVELVMVLLIVTYGGNFFLYRLLKAKKQIQGLEKLAIICGVNMLILLFDGAFIVIAALIRQGSALSSI
ncbi:hypothetical protein ACYSNR_03850 [Enterococcus sp. LJL128]|uniref:hypothetical protein n=1 Tax=Enterococcus sp. LJL51 TaxID=3416656 RepID=UPI003CED70B1